MCERYRTSTRQRAVGTLTRVLSTKFATETLEYALTQWEEDIHRYEIESGQRVTDEIKLAVLLNHTAGPIHKHHKLNVCVPETNQQAINAILTDIRSRQQFGPTPMGIGHVGKGRKMK